MGGFEKFSDLVHRLSRVSCSLGMVFALPLMALTTLDVVGRSFFGKPIPGTLELSEYMLACIILLGAAYTQQVKGHVAVDFVTSRFSPRNRALLECLTLILAMLIVSLLAWQGFSMGMEETAVSDQLRVPKAPFRILLGVGCTLLWLELLVACVGAWQKVLKGGA